MKIDPRNYILDYISLSEAETKDDYRSLTNFKNKFEISKTMSGSVKDIRGKIKNKYNLK